MTTWTEKLPLAIPAIHRDLANRAAALFDPNLRGDLTFPEPNVPESNPTHCLRRTQLVADFVPMLQSKQPEVWYPVLSAMAAERGREALTLEEVETLCASLLFDSECDFLLTDESEGNA